MAVDESKEKDDPSVIDFIAGEKDRSITIRSRVIIEGRLLQQEIQVAMSGSHECYQYPYPPIIIERGPVRTQSDILRNFAAQKQILINGEVRPFLAVLLEYGILEDSSPESE